MTNKSNNVLYCGVTSNIQKRIWEHKNKVVKGFTAKYCIDKLVYYEVLDDIRDAISREKALKGAGRRYKVKLVENFNPKWQDLYYKL